MERWAGRVAVVTGASSGIGEALAKELTKHGMKVAALARRIDRLQKLEEECQTLNGEIKTYKCDVTNENDISDIVKEIVRDLGPISVLVNNAAIALPIKLTESSGGSPRKIYETNVIGLVTFTQHVVELMKEHQINDGHIVNINSLLGHCVSPRIGTANYCASKNAVTILSESLRNELAEMNMKTRVSSISPGVVVTEMSQKIYKDRLKSMPTLNTNDVIECIIFVLKLNSNINISEMTILPTGESLKHLAEE